ncbi:hypothetical protein K501DRAFT_337085 [Backusella circina FSU 941]|nr:hypothetical protein K501DRAFT_337085 [Backusella circina FSU 941]
MCIGYRMSFMKKNVTKEKLIVDRFIGIHSNSINDDEQEPFTSYLFSIFQNLWPSETTATTKKKKKTQGLQPRTAIGIAQVHTVTEPITFDYRDQNKDYDDDEDYLSKSDSTLSSFGSSISSQSSNEDERQRRRRPSSIALSTILCEYYVQRHTQEEEDEKPEKEVPLETFRTFEAFNMTENAEEEEEGWFMGTPSPKQWVQVVDDNHAPVSKRAIRTNSAHLRMLVAEVNMMRANKIICPLKPRGFLPARADLFIPNTPSPLSASL